MVEALKSEVVPDLVSSVHVNSEMGKGKAEWLIQPLILPWDGDRDRGSWSGGRPVGDRMGGEHRLRCHK